MNLLKVGKTKDVYTLDNGNILLKFKDTVTGLADGCADPGGNIVVGEVKGVGQNALEVSTYYFELLEKSGIKTHYVSSDLAKGEMEVMKIDQMFGEGLEFIVRYIATGSFLRRFGLYCKDGDPLNAVFEVTLKDDERNDPPVTKQILTELKVMTDAQYDFVQDATIKICDIIKADLAKKGAVLYDIKLEFGIVGNDVVLIDEVSAGNMRAYKDGKKLSYDELSKLILA